MLKRLAKDVTIYAIGSTLTGSLTILLLPFLARNLTPQEYGVMDLLLTAYSVINVIVPLNISLAMAKYYPRTDQKDRYRYTSTAFWFTLLMYSLYLLAGLLCLQSLTELSFTTSQYEKIVGIALTSMLTTGICTFLQTQLRWMLKPMSYLLTSTLFTVINIFLTVIFFHYFLMRLEGFFLARMIAALITCWPAWFYAKQDYRLFFNFEILKNMLEFSFPLVLANICVFLSLSLDRFIINSLLSLSAVGIYGACSRPASIAGTIMAVLNFALTPLVFSSSGSSQDKAQLAFIFKLLLCGLFCTTIFLLLFSQKILLILVGETYSQGFYVLPLVTASFIIAALYNCAPGLWLTHRTKLIALITFYSAVSNIILCIILVSYIGYIGAAIATLISSLLTCVLGIFFAQKYYHIEYDWPRINAATFLTLLTGFGIVRFYNETQLAKQSSSFSTFLFILTSLLITMTIFHGKELSRLIALVSYKKLRDEQRLSKS